MANSVKNHTLQETEDWFDKITVNRNMKELTGLSKSFNKISTEAQTLQERMSGLYEDMGHILGRYYDIDEMGEGSKSYRHGDEDNEDNAKVKEVEGDKAEYQKFFMAALKKFGVKEPDQLPDEKKAEFYNYVDANWKGDNESDQIVGGYLIYIKVINNNIEKALRKLKKEVKETKLLLELKQNEYYRKPSEIRRERKAKAKIRQKKFIEN